MTKLSQQACEACRADAPKVTGQEKQELLSAIPDWEDVMVDGEEQLRRELLSNLVYGLRRRSCLTDPVLVPHP